jgi:peptidylprolyl isomerase
MSNNLKTIIYSLIISFSVTLIFVSVVVFLGRKKEESPDSLNKKTNENSLIAGPQKLIIEDIQVGQGVEVKPGNTITVNYKGILADGTKFDSSFDRNEPFTTQIGVGKVIPGWDQGMLGMKKGGKRKLTIPPDLGYGSQANAKIPANSTLIFEVEVLEIK